MSKSIELMMMMGAHVSEVPAWRGGAEPHEIGQLSRNGLECYRGGWYFWFTWLGLGACAVWWWEVSPMLDHDICLGV